MTQKITQAGITPRQRIALASLLRGATVLESARNATVTPKTLYRWMREDAFRAALKEAERAQIESLSHRLNSLADKALDALEAVLDSPKASPAARTRAALGILERLLRLREAVTIEDRLAALEALQEEDGQP